MSLTTPGRPATRSSWLTVAVIAVAAVCAGMVLPQILPADSALAETAAPSDASSESTKKPELAYTPPAWPEAPDPKSMILRLVLGTTIVLGLCAGTLVLSKRWLKTGTMKSTNSGPLTLVDTLALGNRCQVHLVGIGKRRILVGIDAGGLKTVVPLVEPFEETLGEVQDAVA